MFGLRLGSWIKALLLLLFVGTALPLATPEAQARAGRGRSSARSPGYSPRPAPQAPPQAPPSQFGNRNPSLSPPMNSPSGGFLRGMAGGIAGGFLGSMLFGSMGHAAGGMGGGGGIGLIEILLFAGLAYFGFKWWKNRQQPTAALGHVTQRHSVLDMDSHAAGRIGSPNSTPFQELAPAGIDSDTASDIFFKVQGAWTRRDLSTLSNLLDRDMQETLGRDCDELKRNQQINRLENISVRRVEVTRSWLEDGQEFSTVRFTANLLDYTVNEKDGAVVDGSDSVPVKFEEDWTFAKPEGSYASWQLVGIRQV